MATSQERKAYKEVLIILEKLNLVQMIPENVIETLKTERDENWQFEYDETLPLEEQNILRDTAILFSNLYLAFVCKDAEEKESLKNIYSTNQTKIDNNKSNNWNEKLANKAYEKSNNTESNESLLINEEKNIFQKILEFFKKFFVEYIM